ncbi:hypothetical protein BJX68DRAFT_268567 [Aspergillus pseudodeflectus]|uniref:Uncharacterized protein n=1 Tax=Aspergillus pseudodeflectus TaxID=176178 RepID=A0ABR4K5E8_9EURO
MPCEDFSQLCSACLERASKCSEPLAREYIPVNSLRLPPSTTPYTFTAETSTQFDTKIGGEVIGKALCKNLEPYLKTRDKKVRRFHMWIRQTTPAERGPNTRRSPKVIITVLADVDTANLTTIPKLPEYLKMDFPTEFKDAARGFELEVGSWEMKAMTQADHASVFRLTWFMALHSPQEHEDCAPYMIWSNFPPLAYGETKPADVKEDPWFIWREKHPTTKTGIPAGAVGSH